LLQTKDWREFASLPPAIAFRKPADTAESCRGRRAKSRTTTIGAPVRPIYGKIGMCNPMNRYVMIVMLFALVVSCLWLALALAF
jgi:hypothetical protein